MVANRIQELLYAFSRVAGTWIEQSKTIHKKDAEADEFGNAVAISEDFAIIGAYRRNLPDKGGMCCDLGVDGGSAYIFHTEEDLNTPLSVEPSILKSTTLGHVKRSALLQNFPNPFNPETWIPYVLVHDASVDIGIYDIQGQLVRQMGLGRQPAGSYLSREDAAYWDGKDQLGEGGFERRVFLHTHSGDISSNPENGNPEITPTYHNEHQTTLIQPVSFRYGLFSYDSF